MKKHLNFELIELKAEPVPGFRIGAGGPCGGPCGSMGGIGEYGAGSIATYIATSPDVVSTVTNIGTAVGSHPGNNTIIGNGSGGAAAGYITSGGNIAGVAAGAGLAAAASCITCHAGF